MKCFQKEVRKACICLVLLVGIVHGLGAQEKQKGISVVRTSVGLYLEFPAMPLNGQMLIVERDKGSGFERIAYIDAPASADVLYQRISKFAYQFPVRQLVTRSLSDTIWTIYASGRHQLIYDDHTPLMQMAFGRALLDTVPGAKAYRVSLGNSTWTVSKWADEPPKPRTGLIKLNELKPDPAVMRASWSLQRENYPVHLKAFRQKIGVDSISSAFDAVLGLETDSTGKLHIHLSDTTVFSGITYHYHLKGYDTFGNLTSLSDTARISASNRAQVNFDLQVGPTSDNDGVLLSWAKLDPHAVRSIRVFKSIDYDSGYVQQAILPSTDTSWADKSAGSGINYYYQIVAQGANDFSFPSPRVFGKYDRQKPLFSPRQVTTTVLDSMVSVAWTYNGIANLYGFRVYRSEGYGNPFVPISDIIRFDRDSLFFRYEDEDASLKDGQFYTYAVAAVNRSYVESGLAESEPVNLLRKDAIPAPVHVRLISPDDSTAVITWEEMSAHYPSVIGYNVLRKTLDAGIDQPFEKLNREIIRYGNEYIDTLVPNDAWQYVVQALDAKNESPYSLPVTVRTESRKPLPPGNLKLFVQPKKVFVQWDPSLNENIVKYNIYRTTGGVSEKLGTVAKNGNNRLFVDESAKSKNLYFYYVTSETDMGIESDQSKELSVRTNW